MYCFTEESWASIGLEFGVQWVGVFTATWQSVNHNQKPDVLFYVEFKVTLHEQVRKGAPHSIKRYSLPHRSQLQAYLYQSVTCYNVKANFCVYNVWTKILTGPLLF